MTPSTTPARRHTRLLPLALLGACISHSVASEPIEIKPIHITMDINLRVQRELDEFFDFEDTAAPQQGTSTEGTGDSKEATR